jgi:predicted transcriptional regulator of viral defense system
VKRSRCHNVHHNTPQEGVLMKLTAMDFATRSLSPQESRVVLALTELGRSDVTRKEIIRLLGTSVKAADHVIEALRKKGWLERAAWGKYLLVPPDQGPEALGDSNLLALASRIVDPYYVGFGTAAAHYGLTTQHRNVIFLVTPARVRERTLGESRVKIINQTAKKFFGFEPVDVLGHEVIMSDREKTALDCIDRPDLAGGIGEAAAILANAIRRFDWVKAAGYIERIGSGTLVHRFGWLVDHVQADMPEDVRTHLLERSAGSRRTWLGSDPARVRINGAIGFDETWRLFVNVTVEELRGSAGLGKRKTLRKDA